MGAHTRTQLAEALAGIDMVLSADELAAIERAMPQDAVADERYGPAAMKHLDSEVPK